jgi:hypothetical protein
MAAIAYASPVRASFCLMRFKEILEQIIAGIETINDSGPIKYDRSANPRAINANGSFLVLLGISEFMVVDA